VKIENPLFNPWSANLRNREIAGFLPALRLKAQRRFILEKDSWKKDHFVQNPAIRIRVPTRMPNMDEDADSIPRRIYPATTPILSDV
jgi:hypothetical protein